MSPRRRSEAPEYRYRWTGDYPAVIDGYSTPGGSGVMAMPGQEFSTTEPLDHPKAEPQGDTPAGPWFSTGNHPDYPQGEPEEEDVEAGEQSEETTGEQTTPEDGPPATSEETVA